VAPPNTVFLKDLPGVSLSNSAMTVLKAAEEQGRLTLVGSVAELAALAVPENATQNGGFYDVGYDVPGKGFVTEARVCRVRNGIAANYLEPYMRRRDPDCMLIADKAATDKPTFHGRFGRDFEPVRLETLDWLKSQPLACFFFRSGLLEDPLHGVAICPANAAFFGMGLAMLQAVVPLDEIRRLGVDYFHRAIVYVAPPFRHTHFDGKQIVVHNRRHEEAELHELFSYNLYPGPSAKKGVYGMLLTAGERHAQQWITAHCSTVRVVTPYDNMTTFMHEGASGGGKSEMLEYIHREADGTLHFGTNVVTDETRYLVIPRGCELHPVTDDMALCHPKLQRPEDRVPKLTLVDAEESWFIRINHITKYGTDPNLESITISPPGPLLFLNIDAKPGATCLIWEHTEDAPGKPCPNPRVVVPRRYFANVVTGPVSVDIRSFGVRCPPCTADLPTYGILGLFHILPPALAWLWRLVAPRGHGNPSIVDAGGMQSEGVGSYWPFATGRRVLQANILLKQIMATANTMFLLIPNQHVGAWHVGFAPQWVTREYIARRGQARFQRKKLLPARCPLLGMHCETIHVEGQRIGHRFFDVSLQPEVGEAAYDEGARMLTEFFHKFLREFLTDELEPQGRAIIQACLNGATLDDYDRFTPEEARD
jgi:hypothetical protein